LPQIAANRNNEPKKKFPNVVDAGTASGSGGL